MSQFTVMSIEEIKALADAKGCEVVVAQPNQLQFDIDSTEDYERYQAFFALRLVGMFEGYQLIVEEWKSSGGNKHILITLPWEFETEARIALQAMGGSDSGREFAALNCHINGSPHPVLLFRPWVAQ